MRKPEAVTDPETLRLLNADDDAVTDPETLALLDGPQFGQQIGASYSVIGLKRPDRASLQERFEQSLERNRGAESLTPEAFLMPPQPGRDLGLAGTGKAFTDIGRGAEQRGRALVGAESPELNAEIAESRARDVPLMNTPQGFTGNLVGNVAAASALPGAGTLLGSALQGTALGASTPTVEGESPLRNTAVGGITALGAHAGLAGAGRVLSPQTPPQARQLIDEGVTLTPGQIVGQGGVVGRTAKATEDKLTSVPLLGDIIADARRTGIDQFNRAALNRAIRPVGGRVDATGHEGLEQAYNIARQAYDDVLPNITLRVDPVLAREIAGMGRLTANLRQESQDQFNNVIQNEVFSRFNAARNGPIMAGEAFKRADTELGRLARTYRGSQIPADRELGDAFGLAQRVLRNGVRRTNPSQAPALRQADSAYSQLLRVERAGSSVGANEGVFTPAQLKSAVRALDPSLRKRAFGQGRAQMQDLAESGQAVLPSKIPDSGTAGRSAIGLGTLGFAGYVEPMAALSGLLAMGAYTRPGLAVLQGALTARPQIVRGAGEGISSLIPLAAPGAAATNLQPR